MVSPTYGTNQVDWEDRLDMGRLRERAAGPAEGGAGAVGLGAVLTFDFHNIRYMTATHIGTWAMDKMIRFAILPRGGDPVLWDFGSAARHHQLQTRGWTSRTRPRAAASSTAPGRHLDAARGDLPGAGRAEDVAAKIARVMRDFGLQGQPIGRGRHRAAGAVRAAAGGFPVVDGQQVFLEARRIKTPDEIGLLTQAASMVDAAYEELYEFLRPGVRENECVGLVTKIAVRPGVRARGGGQRDLGGAVLARTRTCSPTG